MPAGGERAGWGSGTAGGCGVGVVGGDRDVVAGWAAGGSVRHAWDYAGGADRSDRGAVGKPSYPGRVIHLVVPVAPRGVSSGRSAG